jgi:3-methyladenine DNA glycosylase/8-oxoguanine DNA glycosylase
MATNSHRAAINHLKRVDPKLARVIELVGPFKWTPRAEGTHFGALLRAIVYQQLSGKAAATIFSRFLGLYGGREPTPQELVATPDETLRGVGLSRQKLSYLKDLAARVGADELPLGDVETLDDDALIEALTRVKGIGRWTAQMFMQFRLGRLDVFAELDLGLQKGLQHAYRLRAMPKPREAAKVAERWAPYRSVASWYLWRVLETEEAKGAARERRLVAAAVKKGAAKKRAAKKGARRKTASKGARRAAR